MAKQNIDDLKESLAFDRNKKNDLVEKMVNIAGLSVTDKIFDNMGRVNTIDKIAKEAHNNAKSKLNSIKDKAKKAARKYKEESKVVEDKILLEDKEKGLKFVLTKDIELLTQYYQLRNEAFRNEHGWDSKLWLESEDDKRGMIFVVVKGREVIGGLRMMDSASNEYLSEEIEGTEFLYKNVFGNLDLDVNSRYVELDGGTIKKECRDKTVSFSLLKSAFDYCKDKLGCKYVVTIASPASCRNTRILLKFAGYKNVKIAKSIVWSKLKEYNYSEDHPLVCVLND